eukprot:Blabericola_migrator_1__1510@NODE_139_length_13119_cov_94_960389_g121_i0_p2_GENE_NODE_139_length_13119_cov_94_960389_g121_i0NODE_139_length_13119_cov_94_960389_g121_i0_p2_ORF_typecomplete_len519_score91_71_NODE_139_length_13119_cov_94_960389_g121_i063287884
MTVFPAMLRVRSEAATRCPKANRRHAVLALREGLKAAVEEHQWKLEVRVPEVIEGEGRHDEIVGRCADTLMSALQNMRRLIEAEELIKSRPLSVGTIKPPIEAVIETPDPEAASEEPSSEPDCRFECEPPVTTERILRHQRDIMILRHHQQEIAQHRLTLSASCLRLFRPIVIGITPSQSPRVSLVFKLEETFLCPLDKLKAPRGEWTRLLNSDGNRCIYSDACTDHKPLKEALGGDLVTTIDKSTSTQDLANALYMYALLLTSLRRIHKCPAWYHIAFKGSNSMLRMPIQQADLVPCSIPPVGIRGLVWDPVIPIGVWKLQNKAPVLSTVDSGTALTHLNCNSEVSQQDPTRPMTQKTSFTPAAFTASIRRFVRRRPFLGFSPYHVWWDKAFPVCRPTHPPKVSAGPLRVSFPVCLKADDTRVLYHRVVTVDSSKTMCVPPPSSFMTLVAVGRVKKYLALQNIGLSNVLLGAFQVHAAHKALLGEEGGATENQQCPYHAIADILISAEVALLHKGIA